MCSYFLEDSLRRKLDDSNDELFYSQPRYVYHLDSYFRKRLTNMYRERLKKSSVILDLMSSWTSHLPPEYHFEKVIIHGLNEKELQSNTRMDEYWVQNLNHSQEIPLSSESIDTIMIVAGWQYLQYPETLTKELYRITKKGGEIIVSFSDRAFWNKTPYVWSETNDIGRLLYIERILSSNSWTNIQKFMQGNSNFFFDFIGLKNDPFFCVIASK